MSFICNRYGKDKVCSLCGEKLRLGDMIDYPSPAEWRKAGTEKEYCHTKCLKR